MYRSVDGQVCGFAVSCDGRAARDHAGATLAELAFQVVTLHSAEHRIRPSNSIASWRPVIGRDVISCSGHDVSHQNSRTASSIIMASRAVGGIGKTTQLGY
jgi:hypothetical protein